MRSLLVLAVIAMIIYFGVKTYYKPVPAMAPIPVKVAEPPVLSKPPAPILSSEEIQKVIESTKDMSPTVRWQALAFLVQINAPQADGLVLEMLRQDPDAALRKNIVLMLGERHGPKSSEYLVKALQDQEAQVRIAALQMLDKIGDYSAGSAISELLRDTDDSVRLQALTALNSLQTKRSEEIRQQQEEALRQQKKEQQRLQGGGK
jgi:HEAT repeat protein